ncbi:hypothetical protein LR48_Vigan02g254800 [Vigna angularis]|uniref:Uncharacterized protein n=1 Tax=Phaseolus angularis TaxID=3914 RepID=A0A0L9U0P8_PHAAN|nr:hypothetical protein LR48_Vigan02g254800 [Vigna angularis]
MIGLLTFGTWALTIRHFGLPGYQPSGLPNAQPFAHSVSFVQTFNLERSCFRPLSLIDSRSFGLYRSTIHLYEHSSIGPFDPSDDQPIGLNNVRPLASVQHVGLNDVRPPGLHPFASVVRRFTSQHSASLTFDHSASTARPSIETTALPCDPIDVRPPGLKRSIFLHIVYLMQVTVDGQQKTERSTGYTSSGSCSPKNTQDINRSTNHVHERSTGYTPTGNCSPKNTQYIQDTLPWVTVRPRTPTFKQSAVRPPYCFRPLDNLCTSVQAVGRSASLLFSTARQSLYERSSSRPFGLLIVFDRSTISVRAFKQSAVRPPYCFRPLDNLCERTFKQSTVRPPFGFNRSTIPVYEHSSSRSFSLKDVRPLLSTARQSLCTSVQAVDRSTSKVFDLCFQPLVDPCVRAFKYSTVRRH